MKEERIYKNDSGIQEQGLVFYNPKECFLTDDFRN